jgi:hypothetical protein
VKEGICDEEEKKRKRESEKAQAATIFNAQFCCVMAAF